ncbi:MAG TPA: hypothetical protein PLH93_02570 [Flavobacteriales bacterium]|nr:hypothetical protein [Flavobacteriales bacterium]HQW86037.1 hypothetical protein [Flavobacteriales bacterium]
MLFIFGLADGSAQNLVRRYDALGQNRPESGWAVEQLGDSTWFIVLNGQKQVDAFVYSSVVAGLCIDATGEPQDTILAFEAYLNTYPGWANSSDLRQDGGVVVGGSSVDTTGTDRPVLYLFNSIGQLDTMYTYGAPGEDWIGRSAKQTPDGGYIIVGETNTHGTSLDGFLLRLDSAGNQQWVQTYGSASVDEFLVSVDIGPSGGYYLGGQQTVVGFDDEQWVLRVDSNGQVIWDAHYGTPYDEGPNAHLTSTADGNAVFAAGWAYNNSNVYQLGLTKIDSLGTTIWSNAYDTPAFGSVLYSVKEVSPGGDLIAGGVSYVPGYRQGVLLRTTALGDSLWLRYYHYYDTVWSAGRGQIRDVIPTSSGSFIAVGTAYSSNNPNDPPIYGQDTWVVKVDSMGCLEPGCHVVTGVGTQITNLRSVLRVWPNPVQGQGQGQGQAQGQVQVAIELPERFVTRGPLRLTLTDAQGRLVQEESVPQGGSPFSFSLSALAPGLYHLHLSDATRWISGAKVVVR